MFGPKPPLHPNIEGNFLSSVILHEERKHVRFNTNLRCKVQNFKGMRCLPPFESRLANISQGGALLKSNIMIPSGQHIYVKLGNYPYRIGAAVVESSDYGFHVKFLKVLDENVTERIAKGLPYNGILKPRRDDQDRSRKNAR